MRGDLPKREPDTLARWERDRLYMQLREKAKGRPTFVLHDGPPYANGSIHLGHAVNKILKDTINKYQLLQGRKVRYVAGWDCHGLPIELKVLQTLKPEERKQLTPLSLRHKAKEYALKAVEVQLQSFKRYGVWGDWDHPYLWC